MSNFFQVNGPASVVLHQCELATTANPSYLFDGGSTTDSAVMLYNNVLPVGIVPGGTVSFSLLAPTPIGVYGIMPLNQTSEGIGLVHTGNSTFRFNHAIAGTFPRTDRFVFGSPEIDDGSAAIYGVETASTGGPGYLSLKTTLGGTSTERVRVDEHGLTVNSVPSYASNILALAAGLPVGAFYRNGDTLCIVH
jgi:hypothetical protein